MNRTFGALTEHSAHRSRPPWRTASQDLGQAAVGCGYGPRRVGDPLGVEVLLIRRRYPAQQDKDRELDLIREGHGPRHECLRQRLMASNFTHARPRWPRCRCGPHCVPGPKSPGAGCGPMHRSPASAGPGPGHRDAAPRSVSSPRPPRGSAERAAAARRLRVLAVPPRQPQGSRGRWSSPRRAAHRSASCTVSSVLRRRLSDHRSASISTNDGLLDLGGGALDRGALVLGDSHDLGGALDCSARRPRPRRRTRRRAAHGGRSGGALGKGEEEHRVDVGRN